MGCWLVAKQISIGKNFVSHILRNAKALQSEYEFSKGNCKKLNHGQCHSVNEILVAWYKNVPAQMCFQMAKCWIKAMLIKERLNKDELATSTASNGWLEKFKQTYGLRETRITGEADSIPKITIQSWIEGKPELTSGYESRNIWNMDEVALFFKALPEKDLVEKSRKCKGSKKSKLTATVLQRPFL